LSFVASYALTAVLAYKITGKQISLKPLFNMAIWKKTISLSIVLGAIDILNQIYHMADSIMISIFKSPLQVGIYTVSYSLVGIFLFLPDYVMGNLTPVIIGLKRGPKINRLVGDSSEFLTSIGFLIPLFSYFLGKNMVILVSGRGYINAASPFFILTIGLLFSYVATPYLRTCIALEKQKGLLTCTMSTLALNIIINLYTIPHFGLIGAAIATAISEALSLVLILRISKQHINLSVNVQSILRPLLAALFSFVLLLKIDSIWSTGIIELNLITAAIIISLVYVSLLWLFKGIPSIVRDFAKHTYAKYIRL
jgi:O-antigen/teichoic acid export membrane protein